VVCTFQSFWVGGVRLVYGNVEVQIGCKVAALCAYFEVSFIHLRISGGIKQKHSQFERLHVATAIFMFVKLEIVTTVQLSHTTHTHYTHISITVQ
jgi:hypothetical protein